VKILYNYILLAIEKSQGLQGRLVICAIGVLSLCFVGCAPKGTPIFTLSTPHFVPQSQPRDSIETGIGQDPNTGDIFIQWFAASGAAGYKVYRTDTTDANGIPAGFELVVDLKSTPAVKDTSYVDVNSVRTNVRYFYFVKAYASDGSMSNPSDTAHITLLDRPTLNYPGRNATVSANNLSFVWKDNTNGGSTVIRLKDISVIPSVYVWISRDTLIYGGSTISAQFNFDSTAFRPLKSGDSYQWRVDRIDLNTDGQAKSIWQTFTAN